MTHRHPHDAEIRECVECGGQYDLTRQSYYGPLCPDCHAAQTDD